MIRRDLRTYLTSHVGLMNLLQRNGKKHIYLSRIPKSEKEFENYPCIVYRRASGGYGHDLDGADSTAQPQFEFHTLAAEPDQVEAIAEQLRQALQGYRGPMGSSTIGRSTLDNEADDYIEAKIGDDKGFHRTVMIFTIGYQVTIPNFA